MKSAEIAIFNMGLLSMQSGQYERAGQRFEALLELNEENYEAMLYLAVTEINLSNQERAKELLKYIKLNGDDPQLVSLATEYLQDLN